MTRQDKTERKTGVSQHLPYRVELWKDDGERRLLGRAESIALGRAIFEAAIAEHPDDRITLQKADRVLADSNERMRSG